MWSAEARQIIESLVERAELEELWSRVLRALFPPHLAFEIASFKAPSYLTDSRTSVCFTVSRRGYADTCFVLTWNNAGKIANTTTWHTAGSAIGISGTRIHRVHCENTRLTFTRSDPEGRFSQETYEHSPDHMLYFIPGDCDLLEPLGYQRLVSAAQHARARVGVTVGEPVEPLDLGHYELSSSPAPEDYEFGPFESSQKVLSPSPGPIAHQHITNLPNEILLQIVDHLPSADIPAVSLTSSLFSSLTDHRRWRHVRITKCGMQNVIERCETLLRHLERTHHVRSLELDVSWPWTTRLKRLVGQLPSALARLEDFSLLYTLDHDYSNSGHILPALRAFNNPQIHLKSFECEAWLLPESPLWEFLRAQPSIESLKGIDIMPTRVPDICGDLLPSLKILHCAHGHTACYFLPTRPLHVVSVVNPISPHFDIEPIIEGLSQCPGPLTDVTLSLVEKGSESIMHRLAEALSRTRILQIHIREWFGREDLPFPFLLPELEDFYCAGNPGRKVEEIEKWVSQIGPKILRVSIWSDFEMGVWRRQKDGRFLASDMNDREPLSHHKNLLINTERSKGLP
ncbi:hypothetical protein DL93DRAFT_100814 [Clavulina sp. PMI_390]|nr:hypothetical protein DL93DRAFT_100814 [Clavulina sp. PMI_390]